MRRFSALQLFLLAFGFGLILAGLFFNQIARGWENYRYPNAVYWQGMRWCRPETNSSQAPARTCWW